MSKTEHTPTPWRYSEEHNVITVSRPGIIEGSKTICDINANINFGDNPEEHKANASFIVRACNNHKVLVEALEEAAAQIEYLHGKFGETGSGNAALVRAGSALKKAKQ